LEKEGQIVTINKHHDEVFDGLRDHDSGRIIEGVEFEHCTFRNCHLSVSSDPNLRTTVRDVQLSNCQVVNCLVHAAIFRDVQFNDLISNDIIKVWGAVFERVTLAGTFGSIMLSPLVNPLEPDSPVQRTFDAAAEQFYASVDWALDISNAVVEELDIRSVPAALIRRDPETQVVVRRANVAGAPWRGLDLPGTYLVTLLELFLESDAPDAVLVAPKRDPHMSEYVQGLRILQRAGVADPD
jgi:hypothetical protein